MDKLRWYNAVSKEMIKNLTFQRNIAVSPLDILLSSDIQDRKKIRAI